MPAGRLRSTVEVLRHKLTRGANGESLVIYESIGLFAADIQPLSGQEVQESGAFGEEQNFTIRMRYGPTLARLRPADRIKRADVLFNILWVQNTGTKNEELLIGARQFVPDAEAQRV